MKFYLLSEDVNVIAWGLSLERPTMIKYHIDNIRDLVGHKVGLNVVFIQIQILIIIIIFPVIIMMILMKVDLNMVQSNPLCRLETADTAEERRVAALSKRFSTGCS